MSPAWQMALRWALSRGLTPAVFWQLSLPEWRALTASEAARPLARAGLNDLCAKYPDEVP
ncbi:phage tail assembly chaperone [Maricaulis sp.]|uniref:phage tail assembly chaperone n=1 Tax=Maricaulis sp. TaxID=1486257 RepID=UPI002611E883|nr:phage tail assembly chaperone [Maricaulis sp.]